MKKILICLLGILAFAFHEANAQRYNAIQYSIAFPSGDLNDYIGEVSFRGVQYDYRALVNPNVSVGFSVAWNVFYDENSDPIENGTLVISGKQFRYTNSVPIYFTADYFQNTDSDVRPFVGIGVGTVYTERKTELGIYQNTCDAWQFAIAPEVGVMYDYSDFSGLILSARYNAAFKGDGLDGQPYFSVNVGFVFTSP
ncbi:OmpW family protein [Limibacter armeniacum]|uniref:OmpW family protein n=1 Tax=Limibacter armeniacum TaxID=466084 RepID=UPI002FE63D51